MEQSSQDVRPLVHSLSPEEVTQGLDQGILSDDDAYDYIVHSKIEKGEWLNMEPDEATHALDQGYINEKQAENYINYKENPKWSTFKDWGTGVVHGVRDAAQEAIETWEGFSNWLIVDKLSTPDMNPTPGEDQHIKTELPEPEKPFTGSGNFVEGVAQFSTGFIPGIGVVGKGLKATRLAALAKAGWKGKWAYNFIEGTLAGAAADAMVTDPYEHRVSNLVDNLAKAKEKGVVTSVAKVLDPIADALKADESDPMWLAKLKTSVEGALTGAVAEPFVKLATEGFVRAVKYGKAKLWAKHNGDATAVAADVNATISQIAEKKGVTDSTYHPAYSQETTVSTENTMTKAVTKIEAAEDVGNYFKVDSEDLNHVRSGATIMEGEEAPVAKVVTPIEDLPSAPVDEAPIPPNNGNIKHPKFTVENPQHTYLTGRDRIIYDQLAEGAKLTDDGLKVNGKTYKPQSLEETIDSLTDQEVIEWDDVTGRYELVETKDKRSAYAEKLKMDAEALKNEPQLKTSDIRQIFAHRINRIGKLFKKGSQEYEDAFSILNQAAEGKVTGTQAVAELDDFIARNVEGETGSVQVGGLTLLAHEPRPTKPLTKYEEHVYSSITDGTATQEPNIVNGKKSGLKRVRLGKQTVNFRTLDALKEKGMLEFDVVNERWEMKGAAYTGPKEIPKTPKPMKVKEEVPAPAPKAPAADEPLKPRIYGSIVSDSGQTIELLTAPTKEEAERRMRMIFSNPASAELFTRKLSRETGETFANLMSAARGEVRTVEIVPSATKSEATAGVVGKASKAPDQRVPIAEGPYKPTASQEAPPPKPPAAGPTTNEQFIEQSLSAPEPAAGQGAKGVGDGMVPEPEHTTLKSDADIDSTARKIVQDQKGMRETAEVADFESLTGNGPEVVNMLTTGFNMEKSMEPEVAGRMMTRIMENIERDSVSVAANDKEAFDLIKEWTGLNMRSYAQRFKNMAHDVRVWSKALDLYMETQGAALRKMCQTVDQTNMHEMTRMALLIENFGKFARDTLSGQGDIARALRFKRELRTYIPDGVLPFDINSLDNGLMQEFWDQKGDLVKKLVVNFGDPKLSTKQRARFARMYRGNRFSEAILELKQSAILSGIATFFRNVYGNGMNLGKTLMDNWIAVGLEKLTNPEFEAHKYLQGQWHGAQQATHDLFQLTPKEAWTQMADAFKASYQAAIDGGEDRVAAFWKGRQGALNQIQQSKEIGKFYQAFATGESQLDFMAKTGELGGAIPNLDHLPIGDILRSPFLGLTGVDEIFQNYGYHWALNNAIYTEGFYQKGFRGEALDAYIEMCRDNIPANLHLQALKASRELTFKDSPHGKLKWLGKWINSFEDSNIATQALWPIGKAMFVPFDKVAMAIESVAMRNTPLGLASNVIWEELKAGGIRRKVAAVQLTTGTMIMLAGAELAKMHLVRGVVIKKDQGAAQAIGVQPYSLLGEYSKSLNGLDPLVTPFFVGANLYHMWEHYQFISNQSIKDYNELFHTGVAILAEGLTRATYMDGVHNLFKMMYEDPSFTPGKWAAREIGSYVPFNGLMRDVNRIFGRDDTLRDLGDLFKDYGVAYNAFIGQYLNPSHMLPKRHPLWGTPMEMESRTWWFGNQTKVADDPVEKLIGAFGLSVDRMDNKISIGGQSIELTAQEFDRAQENITKLQYKDKTGLKEILNEVMFDPRMEQVYKNQDKATMQRVMNGVISAVRRAAKMQIVKNEPDVRKRIEDEFKQRVDSVLGLYLEDNPAALLYHMKGQFTDGIQ